MALFIGFLLFVFIGIPAAVGFLLYFILRRLGYPKAAKYLTIGYGILIVGIGSTILFEDQLFTKSNARKLVEEQGFELTDDFILLKNESSFAIGDYQHIFTLEISERDKQNAIVLITGSNNFKSKGEPIKDLMFQPPDKYFGKKVVQNYETNDAFVREYFKPSGQSGFAPTFRRISISKTRRELAFLDFDD